jgi:UDP-N-acetylmuramoylalanine--D-glutamate ligase
MRLFFHPRTGILKIVQQRTITGTGRPLSVAILGFGREGRSVLSFIRKRAPYRRAAITVRDRDDDIAVPPGVKKLTGRSYLVGLAQHDIIFRSPGVPWNTPELVAAREAGVRCSSLTQLFFEHCPGMVIGITGTKGKGTTATLLFKILTAAKKDAYLAGNIGVPALELLPKLTKRSLVVLELSSFQLQGLRVSPPVAALLDIFPDHQDAHRDLKEYYDAKAVIAKFQKKSDRIFYLATNPVAKRLAAKSRGRAIAVDPRRATLFRPAELKIKGPHHFRNAAMAAAIARALGVPQRTIRDTVLAYRGMPHRLEFVRRAGPVSFYDDSASTNPQTAAAAILAFPGENNILIAGGQDKRLDYEPLADALTSKDCRNGSTLVILFGENKQKIKKALAPACAVVHLTTHLKAAVDYAYETAKMTGTPVNIILSPGAASFDMFQNYADRGDQFKRIVRALGR